MLTIGYMLFLKNVFIEKQEISFLDWERKIIGTRVIDKKILDRMQTKIKEDGAQKETMSQLYDEYLREIYNAR